MSMTENTLRLTSCVAVAARSIYNELYKGGTAFHIVCWLSGGGLLCAKDDSNYAASHTFEEAAGNVRHSMCWLSVGGTLCVNDELRAHSQHDVCRGNPSI